MKNTGTLLLTILNIFKFSVGLGAALSVVGERNTNHTHKLAKFFKQHFSEIITSISNKKLIKHINTLCRYDKRYDRINTHQLQDILAA